MGLRSRRGAARAGSNLGHFPAQFEPNSATLYIIQPAHRAAAPQDPPSSSHACHLYTSVLLALKSRHTENSCVVRRVSVAARGQEGRQSAGRTWANKIDFLSARYDASWRHCLLLPLKCGHRFSTEFPDETLHESDFIDLETLTFSKIHRHCLRISVQRRNVIDSISRRLYYWWA